MDSLAFVFSGQGAQSPGMGKELFDSVPMVKKVFDQNEIIRPGTTSQCFSGNAQTLNQTINAQPCLYTLSLSVAAALSHHGVTPARTAGFSLGEISALAYGGVFFGDDGFRFVCERAEIMEKSSNDQPAGMSAVLKLSTIQVEELCRDIGGMYPVNYNSPGQLVVAGDFQSLEKLAVSVKALGGRALPLKVSGAFHSPFMNNASEALCIRLEDYSLSPPLIPVYANLTALPYDDDPAKLITQQVNHPVLWQQTIENMIRDGITDFIEIGAGSTLCGLIAKIDSKAQTMSVSDKESFDYAVQRYGKEPFDA